jgi:hypothetical protein
MEKADPLRGGIWTPAGTEAPVIRAGEGGAGSLA